MVVLLYNRSQTVDPTAHVRITADKVYIPGLSDIPQHGLTPTTEPQRPDIPAARSEEK